MTAKRSTRKRSWGRQLAKWLGIAGLLGVAAGGALVVRDERQRQAYTPDEVRARLRERAARATQSSGAAPRSFASSIGLTWSSARCGLNQRR